MSGLVVIGAGLAAAHVVTTLREAGDDRPITVVGDEPDPPYERPGLSKSVLLGKAEPEALLVHPPAWYADNDVDLRLGVEATGLDTAGRGVELGTGERLAYDDLVLATGARPRLLPVPGSELDGVLTLRRIPDNQRLRDALGEGR